MDDVARCPIVKLWRRRETFNVLITEDSQIYNGSSNARQQVRCASLKLVISTCCIYTWYQKKSGTRVRMHSTCDNNNPESISYMLKIDRPEPAIKRTLWSNLTTLQVER